MGQFDNLKMARSEIEAPGANHFVFFLDTENSEAPTLATGPEGSVVFTVLPYSQTTITAPVLAANADDWDFEGLADAQIVRIAASVPGVKITGLESSEVPSTAVRKLLVNVGDEIIELSDQDSDSAAANQFLLLGGTGSIYIQPGDSQEVWLDIADDKWRSV
jgi:hypothetical protein